MTVASGLDEYNEYIRVMREHHMAKKSEQNKVFYVVGDIVLYQCAGDPSDGIEHRIDDIFIDPDDKREMARINPVTPGPGLEEIDAPTQSDFIKLVRRASMDDEAAPAAAEAAPPAPPAAPPLSADPPALAAVQLRTIIERIERVEAERRALGDDIKEIYAEAKGNGYDTKIIRRLIAERREDAAQRAEREAVMDTYRHALGMLSDTPLGAAAMSRAA